MMRIERICIDGSTTSDLSFRGELVPDGVSMIVTGDNGLGKSTMGKAVVWCLGVEILFGGTKHDPDLFPEACRERIMLDGAQRAVRRCAASITIVRNDGVRATITRAIAGGDSTLASVTYPGDERDARWLRLGGDSMQDEVGGFFGWLFQWLGMPFAPLRTREGRNSRLYLENLATLFYIEQLKGWIDLFSTQVRRYGLQEVDPACVEYALGLQGMLDQRYAQQSAGVEEAELRAEGRQLFGRFNQLVRKATADHVDVQRIRLKDMASWLSSLDVASELAEAWSETFEDRRRRLEAERADLAAHFSDGAADEAQERDARRHILGRLSDGQRATRDQERAIHTLAQQYEAYQTLVRELAVDQRATRDLLRLKESDIGFPELARCPTCEQEIRLTNYQVANQSVEQVAGHQQTLEAERQALRASLAALQADMQNARVRHTEARTTTKETRRELAAFDESVSPDRERQAAYVAGMVTLERHLARLDELEDEARALQLDVSDWASRFKALHSDALDTQDEEGRLRRFQEQLRAALRALRHTAVMDEPDHRVYLDDWHRPVLNGRSLAALGSASDRARMVLAYMWALAATVYEVGGWHPGFLVLDEPKQQNPDESHERALVEFLATSWNEQPCQVLLFTKLEGEEILRLREAEVEVTELYDRTLTVRGGQ